MEPRPSPPAGGGIRCPVCGPVGGPSPVESISFRDIWRSLSEEWGARFPADVVERHTPAGTTVLFECGACGLQFFAPALPGDAAFYRSLGEAPAYYAPWKWEFDWVKERLSPGVAVLDVGCGGGEFLARVAPVAGRTVGVEWGPDAVARARGRGLEVREGDLAGYTAEFEGAFDAVCAFHVLEHLPEPAGFLGSLRRCLRPGGSLYLSVPNRLRSGRAPLEPLDCPPHHLTRWSPDTLAALARRCGLSPAEVATEPVELSVPRDRLRERIRDVVGQIPAVGGILGTWLPRIAWRAVFFPPLLSLYRRYGVLERAGFFGPSVAVRCVEAPS